jgi:bifunctional non-homologous end joining protein LigD
MLHIRSRLKIGSVAPCLPHPSKEPPPGPGWIHEIKQDGFRIMARRDGKRVRLYTRNGYDFADRFPQIVDAVSKLPVQSCFIDGEAIVVDERGLSVFDLLRYRRYDHAAILCAFDLIELDGDDLRSLAIEHRKVRLERILRPARRSQTGITLNEHYEGDGAVIYKHVCEFGCEGIVSKRVGSPYRSGRSDHWLKIKNPMAPAVRREADENWGRKRNNR